MLCNYRNRIFVLFLFLFYTLAFDQNTSFIKTNEDDSIKWAALDSDFNYKNHSDIDTLREEAQKLRDQAEKLYDIANDFENKSDNFTDVIKDLEDETDEMESEAENLLKQSAQIENCFGFSEDSNINSSKNRYNSLSTEELLKEQKALLVKMRNKADQLLSKTQEISVKIREMGEKSDKNYNLSETFEEKAKELEAKARELEQEAKILEKKQPAIPHKHRFPFLIGQQVRFSSVSSYDDKKPYILIFSGFSFSYYINKTYKIGIEDLTLYFNKTSYGKRVAFNGSTVFTLSHFFIPKCEIGGGIGIGLQSQVGGNRGNTLAVAPFIKLFNQFWIMPQFSIGSIIKFHYLANGLFFTRSFPIKKSKPLTENSWWIDLGISYYFHF
ncbi:MAG: hypothetical protein PVI26_13180 [Chitinispirillia bacterium]|jgi:hypothetical protein